MADFDSIMADMGVESPQNRAPSAEELQQIFSGARKMSQREAPQLEIEPEIAAVEQPILEDTKDSARTQIESRQAKIEDAKRAREEAAISRDLERSGVPQGDGAATEGFAERFGKNLIDNPFTRGLTAIPRAILDVPSDIQEAGEEIAESEQERGDILSGVLSETDFSDTGEVIEATKETASQVLGTAGDFIGAIFMTALKAPVTQRTEDKISEMVQSAAKSVSEQEIPGTDGKTVADGAIEVGKAWDEFEARDPEAARTWRLGGNLAQFAFDVLTAGAAKKPLKAGAEVIEQEAKAGLEATAEAISKVDIPKVKLPKFKTGVKAVDDVVGATPTKIAKTLGPKMIEDPSFSGKIVQRIHRVLPSDAEKFAERAKMPLGEWLVERGIVDTPEKTMKQLFVRFKSSMTAVDDAFSKIKGTFDDASLRKAGDELLDLERQIAKSGVASKDKKLIENLVSKLKKGGLTMSEVNSLKRLYSRKVKTEYLKDATKTSVEVQAKTNVESAIREFQKVTAKELGFDDLERLNIETSLSKQALDAIGKKYLRSMSNNAVSLTDYVLATGTSLNPAFLGTLIGKKVASSETVQAFLARTLARKRPKLGAPKADLSSIERKAKLFEKQAIRRQKSANKPVQSPKVKIRKKPSVKTVEKNTPVVKK